ncbi:MAG TPA: membrane protein insertion efficiency factor YidD [Gaiellales bacterium]|nr:membrane protein insertion efficiency factor YidD [Gaiellales bacterium]
MIRLVVVAMLRLARLALTPFVAMTSITPRVCRYEPTCSHYAEQAVRRHGVVRGLGLAAWRLLRCNPWSKGGYDPVPGDDREVTA